MFNAPILIGVAAACMARGLDEKEADAVWAIMKGRVPAASAGGTYRHLDEAIREVLETRVGPA